MKNDEQLRQANVTPGVHRGDNSFFQKKITYWISRVIWDKVNKVRVVGGPFTLPVMSDYLVGDQRRLTDEPPVRYASGLVIGH